jgi:hypothetical protein
VLQEYEDGMYVACADFAAFDTALTDKLLNLQHRYLHRILKDWYPLWEQMNCTQTNMIVGKYVVLNLLGRLSGEYPTADFNSIITDAIISAAVLIQ